MSFSFAECALWLPTLNVLIIIIIKIMTRSGSACECSPVCVCVCDRGTCETFQCTQIIGSMSAKITWNWFYLCFVFWLQHTHGISVIQMEWAADRGDHLNCIGTTESVSRMSCDAIYDHNISNARQFFPIQLEPIAGHIVESGLHLNIRDPELLGIKDKKTFYFYAKRKSKTNYALKLVHLHLECFGCKKEFCV